jgi:hypothetical protein
MIAKASKKYTDTFLPILSYSEPGPYWSQYTWAADDGILPGIHPVDIVVRAKATSLFYHSLAILEGREFKRGASPSPLFLPPLLDRRGGHRG